LKEPNGASHSVLATQATLEPGQFEVFSAAFKTSDFTGVTGAFTLKGFLTNVSSGEIIAERDLPLTVLNVPANFIASSIGGQGPVSARLGYTTDYQTVVANVDTSSKSLKTNTTLIETDGTEIVLSQSEASLLNPGQSVATPWSVTTSQYSTIA